MDSKNILVLGGTRYAGVHMVEELLAQGHSVTVATRGNIKHNFSKFVHHLIVDRKDYQSLKSAFNGLSFDAVVDNLAFSSKDVVGLLDNVATQRCVMTSSASVYTDMHLELKESEVDSTKQELLWLDHDKFSYVEMKRQAEAALFQKYAHLSTVAVRFPWIFGTDDYTKRLYFYIEHIVMQKPMYIDNPNEPLGFISSKEAGRFLAWCVSSNIEGAVNASSRGTVTIGEIIEYTQKASGKKAILQDGAEAATLNSAQGFSLNLDRASECGFVFENVWDWLSPTIDFWIESLK